MLKPPIKNEPSEEVKVHFFKKNPIPPINATSNQSPTESKRSPNIADVPRYLYNFVTEIPEHSKALVTWKSVVFPSVVFLLLLSGGISGWTPFIASVIFLAFVQGSVTRELINNTVRRNTGENPSRGIAGVLGGVLLAYIVGLGFVFAFLVPGVCEVQGWANTKFLPKKVCTGATDGLNQFLQSNNGGQYR